MVSPTSEQRDGFGNLSEATQYRIALIRAERRAFEVARNERDHRAARRHIANGICFAPETDSRLVSMRRHAATEALAMVGLLAFLIALTALYVIAPSPVVAAV